MLRFVILTHDFPAWHWDFMLEQTSNLRTWRLLSDPESPNGVCAEPLAAHRSEYLDYQGPVGGNRGTVQRWDRGEYETVEDSTHRVVVRLNGTRLKGLAALQMTTKSDDPRGLSVAWTFQFTPEAAGAPEPGN